MSNKNGKAARSLKTLYGELAKLTALRRAWIIRNVPGTHKPVSELAQYDEEISDIDEEIAELERRGDER